MKLRAPAHCTGFSHAGRTYDVGPDGVVAVDNHLVPLFLAHGFTACAETGAPCPTSGAADLPDVGTLNRQALFALLRARGVRVRLPITNAALREAARRSLAKD